MTQKQQKRYKKMNNKAHYGIWGESFNTALLIMVILAVFWFFVFEPTFKPRTPLEENIDNIQDFIHQCFKDSRELQDRKIHLEECESDLRRSSTYETLDNCRESLEACERSRGTFVSTFLIFILGAISGGFLVFSIMREPKEKKKK
jgi:hypothetical protein